MNGPTKNPCDFSMSILRSKMDPSGFEPEAPALQGRCSTRLSYGPDCVLGLTRLCELNEKSVGQFSKQLLKPLTCVKIKGGDPAAGSPTATL